MRTHQNTQHLGKGKFSVLVMALSGALASMTPAQAQTSISGPTTGPVTWDSNDVTFDNTASVSGAATGVTSSGSTIGNLSNTGSIHGSATGINISSGASAARLDNNGGVISGGTYGIAVFGTISTLTNSGTISANDGSFTFLSGIALKGSIQTLVNSGTISAGFTGISNQGNLGTLINQGLITGTYNGIISYNNNNTPHYITLLDNDGGTISGRNLGLLLAGGAGIVLNSGTITGDNAALITSSTVNTLDNSGLISGPGMALVNSGTITTLRNSGTIRNSGALTSTSEYAVANYGVIGTLSNSGIISSPATALFLDTGSALGQFTNSGTIAGSIVNNSGTALTIAGGSGSVFGTLTGYSGTLGSSLNNIGNITSTSGLLFASGNHLLNDNINAGAGTVTNAGTLQVNNPLTITGNYSQGSGASLQIDVSGTSSALLVVTGNASLDASTIRLTSQGYRLAQGQRYVVLAAGGTLSASNATYSAAGFVVTATQQSDTGRGHSGYTDLVLQLGSGPAYSVPTNNAATALNGLFRYGGIDTNLLALFNPAAALDAAGANKAGAQLNPSAVNSAATQAANASNNAIFNLASGHMDAIRVAQAGGSGIATGERATDIALWGQVFGGRAAQGERDDIAGFHANYRGALLGADTATSDTLRVGGLFSAIKTSVANDGNNTGSSASIDSYGLTGYATYSGTPWYVNAMAGAARQQYGTVRDISYTGFSGVARGNFNGMQYQTSVLAGYPLNLDAWIPGATLTPLAGLSYSTVRVNGYTESGGNGAALRVNASSYHSLKSELGAKLESTVDTGYGKLLPSLQLGWRHEYRNDAAQSAASFVADSTGATSFLSKNSSPVANLAVLNLGVTLLQSQHLNLSAKYTLEAGGGYTAQTGSLQLRWLY